MRIIKEIKINPNYRDPQERKNKPLEIGTEVVMHSDNKLIKPKDYVRRVGRVVDIYPEQAKIRWSDGKVELIDKIRLDRVH